MMTAEICKFASDLCRIKSFSSFIMTEFNVIRETVKRSDLILYGLKNVGFKCVTGLDTRFALHPKSTIATIDFIHNE